MSEGRLMLLYMLGIGATTVLLVFTTLSTLLALAPTVAVFGLTYLVA